MANTLHGLGHKEDRGDQGSGVHRLSKADQILRYKRDAFEKTLLEMESDVVLKNLISPPRHGARKENGGTLFMLVDQLRDFEEKYLTTDEKFFDLQSQAKDLAQVHRNVMDKVVAKWPEFMAQGVDWYQLNGAISAHMLRMAGVFGLSAELHASMQEWTAKYTKNEERKHKLREREMLNAEALNAHNQLAYLSAQGKSTPEVIDQVRHRIDQIDTRLRHLPIDPEALPAFSVLNPLFQQKVVIGGEIRNELRPSVHTLGQKVVRPEIKQEAPKKVSGWRAAAKKIPLLGRFF